jgi:hypothetical protein
VKVTPKTLTDEQVAALAGDPRSSLLTKAWCDVATRSVSGDDSRKLAVREEARQRVCDIINEQGGGS